jgi:hypothetical protein
VCLCLGLRECYQLRRVYIVQCLCLGLQECYQLRRVYIVLIKQCSTCVLRLRAEGSTLLPLPGWEHAGLLLRAVFCSVCSGAKGRAMEHMGERLFEHVTPEI